MATEKRRLIDADALMEEIEFEYDLNYGEILTDPRKFADMVEDSLTVDAVPVDDMKEFAEDVVYQFGYYGQYNGRLHIGHGGLSTLEWAFDILGWDNPHPAPEFECEIGGCHEHATCGAPTSDGYKRMCGKHYAERRTNERKAD